MTIQDNNRFFADLEKMIRRLELPEQEEWGRDDQAAVLTALIQEDGQPHFLLTRRTHLTATHKGQISFPGGRAEREDTGPEATALRETEEEIGVPTRHIRILGRLPTFAAPGGLSITPVVGVLAWPIPLILSAQEVSRVIQIPVAWFEDAGHMEYRDFTDLQGVTRQVIYYQDYAGDIVWGITANIIHDLIDLLHGRPAIG